MKYSFDLTESSDNKCYTLWLNGKVIAVYEKYANSKQEAKHKAALVVNKYQAKYGYSKVFYDGLFVIN